MTVLMLLWLAGTELTLEQRVTVRGDVYLSDVLTKQSYAALKRGGVRNLKVSSSPDFRRNQVIRRDEIIDALESAYPDKRYDWDGPANVVVRLERGDYDREAVVAAVRDWAESLESPLGTVHVDKVVAPTLSSVPIGEVRYEVRPRGHFEPVGRRSLWVDIHVEDQLFKTIGVQVGLSVETLVGVLRTGVERERRVTDDMVDWSYQRLDRLDGTPIQPDDLDDLCARSILRPGTLLTSRHLVPIDLVERRQNVTVVARAEGLEITMRAVALEDGAAGEIVRLENPETGKTLTGRVAEDGRVIVDIR